MNPACSPPAAGDIRCRARSACPPGALPGQDTDAVRPQTPSAPCDAAVLGGIEETARSWAAAICAFLRLGPPEGEVVVTLRPGPGVPMTRGTEVILPLDGDKPDLRPLAHELVHVVAGRSPSPLLNEGLAVHVDSRLRLAGAVWPFYQLNPDRWVADLRDHGGYLPLAQLVAARPRISPRAAPDRGVTAGAGPERPPALTRFYLEAASLAGLLLDMLGPDRFWRLYREGRPVPEECALTDLEVRWLRHVGSELSVSERAWRDRSLAQFVDRDRWRAPPGASQA